MSQDQRQSKVFFVAVFAKTKVSKTAPMFAALLYN